MKKLIIYHSLCLLLISNTSADTKEYTQALNLKAPTTFKHPFSMGFNIGSLGLGANFSLPIKENIAIRTNINKFKYNLNKKYKKVSFQGDLNLFNVGLLIDYFPANNFFKFSLGGYLNKNKVSGISNFNKSITVKAYHVTRKITDHIKIESEAKFNNISPYIGIGWGNNIKKKGWNTSLDFGVLYQGLPNITYEATTKYPRTKDILKKDIKKEKARLKKFANKYKFYPLIAVGISYSF